MERFLYESHLGGLFVTTIPLTDNERYCEICGDYDWFVGSFDSPKEFWTLVWPSVSSGSSGWALRYVYPLFCRVFEELRFPIDTSNPDDWKWGFCSDSDDTIVSLIHDYIPKIN